MTLLYHVLIWFGSHFAICGTNEVAEAIKGKNICVQCFDEIKKD